MTAPKEPICAACGRLVSVCTADPEGCAPAISKEALAEAWALPADPTMDDIAVVLQRHMDAKVEADKVFAASLFKIGDVWLERNRAVASKAALIAEIRSWNEDAGETLHDSLEAILAEYEDKP